jgi:NADH-quinone oxidoreductase subunit L
LMAREAGVEALSAVIALAGIWLAFYLYRERTGITAMLKQTFAGPYKLLLNKYYIDEFYSGAIVEPGKELTVQLSRYVDSGFIDGAVNGAAWLIGALGQVLRPLQTGFIRNYAWYICVGAVLVIALLWARGWG